MECLELWARTHRQTVAMLAKARRLRVRCAPFSGWHALVHNLRPATSDLDLFTHPEDFERVRGLLPEGQTDRHKAVAMRDSSGAAVCFEMDEFTTVMDGVSVQVIRPLSPVFVGGQERDLSRTDLAASQLRPCIVGGAAINILPEADTVLTKSLFQRGGDTAKSDWNDVVGLAPFARAAGCYLMQRAEECGFGVREYAYLGAAGIEIQFQESRTNFDLAA
jgi:hypothetical protein